MNNKAPLFLLQLTYMKHDSQSIKIDDQTKKGSNKRIIHNVEPFRPYPTTRPRRFPHLLLLLNPLDASAAGDGASRQNRRRRPAPPRGGPRQDQSREKTVRRRRGDDAIGGDARGEGGERGRGCHGGGHGGRWGCRVRSRAGTDEGGEKRIRDFERTKCRTRLHTMAWSQY